MKKYLLLTLFVLVLVFVNGCHKNTDKFVSEEMKLMADSVLLDKVFSPDFMVCIDDKLIISSSMSDTMLHVYSLPSLKHLNSIGRKGQGPDEFQLFPMFCNSQSDSLLYIWGFSPTTIKKFVIDHDGALDFRSLIMLPKYESFNNMHIIDDSLFIYYLPDLLKIVKLDLKNNIDLEMIQMKKDDHNESYFYSNRGLIAVNDSFLLHGYLFRKQIDIYRVHDFSLKKEVIGDYKFEKPVLGDFNTTIYYRGIIACKNYFYALCNENSNRDVVMEVYDYDGLLVKKFSFDIPPQLFVIDEENSTIYGYNEKYEDYLLRYKF